ncbi:MAG: permease prefix domain 1-containing protein [Alicyclobacillus sp.]|nr:permease prefix domain 1-containing protein [Alicyclobacillus sp.]
MSGFGTWSAEEIAAVQRELEAYVRRIVCTPVLTRREQADWTAEMTAHLLEQVSQFADRGQTPDEAVAHAIHQFGVPRELRRQIDREALGYPPSVLLIVACIGVVLLLCSLYALYWAVPPVPSMEIPWHPPRWVSLFTQGFPLSPSLMLAWTLACLAMFRCRSRRDRGGIGVTILLFACAWIGQRALHTPSLGATLTFYGAMGPVHLLDPAFLAGCTILFGLGLALYRWTQNRIVSLFPIALSVAEGLLFPVRNAAQAALYHLTGNPALWGHWNPFTDTFTVLQLIITVAARAMVLGLLLALFRRFDRQRGDRASAQAA